MATQMQCEYALEQFEGDLSRHKNVVGLGVVPATESGNSRSLAVALYVRKLAALKPTSRNPLPNSLRINWRGSEIDVPVRVIEQGTVELESSERL